MKKITIQRAFNLFTQYFNRKSNFKVKKERPDAPKSEEKSIFIVGCERSGTTLIEKILDKHSKIAICPETHFWMDGIDKKIDKILNQKSNLVPMVELKKLVDGFKEFSDHWDEYALNPSDFLESNKISNTSSISIYKMIIEGQARKRRKQIFGEKTPGHVFFVDKIIEIYPDARIIQMIRDPRDTSISRLKKKTEQSKSIVDKLLNGIFVNIEWNLSSKLARIYQKLFPDIYLIVYFEELLQNPREEINRICKSLGINFEENMLNVDVINSSFSDKSTGFNKSIINRWESNMPLWLELIVNFVNGREMKIMGYKQNSNPEFKEIKSFEENLEKKMKYAIITPVRNEEKNLSKLAESIINQTILPQIWTIVDDNSSDSSPKIIDELARKYSWINKTKKQKNEPYGHLSFARTVKTGFNHTLEICKCNNIELNYIGKIDADIILPANYFEKLMEKFKDPELGIASGTLYVQSNVKEQKNQVFFIKGHIPDERLYRMKCLKDIGGFPITYAPDTILLEKAKLKGWKAESYSDIQIYATRDRMMSSGGWKGSKTEGYLRYYLNYHPLLVVILAISKLIELRPDLSIAIFIGYFEAIIKKKSKIDDDEIKNYFRKKRLKEVINNVL